MSSSNHNISTSAVGGKVSSARRCTDSGWILNLILVWTLVAIIAVASVGLLPSAFIQAGSKLRLYGLMDYRGNFCGVSEEVQTLPFLWRPNDAGSNYNNRLEIVPPKFGICVESCPKFDESRSDPYNTVAASEGGGGGVMGITTGGVTIATGTSGGTGLGTWRSDQVTINVAGVCQDVHRRLPGDIWRSVWVDIDLVWGVIIFGSTILPLTIFAALMTTYLSCFGHSSNCMNWVVKGLMWKVCLLLLGGGVVCIYNSYHKDMIVYSSYNDSGGGGGGGGGGGSESTDNNSSNSNRHDHIPKSSVEIEFQRVTGLIMLSAAVLWMLMMTTVTAKRVATALDLMYSLILLLREQPVLLLPPLLGLYLLVELTYYTYFFGIHIASSSSVATYPLFPNATASTIMIVNATTNTTQTVIIPPPEYQYIVYDEHIEPYLYMLFALFCWSGWIVNAFTQLVMSNLVWKWYGLIEARATDSEMNTVDSDDGDENDTGAWNRVKGVGGNGSGVYGVMRSANDRLGTGSYGGDKVLEEEEEEEVHSQSGTPASIGGVVSDIGIMDVYRSYVLVMSNHIGTAACGSIYIHAFLPLRLFLRPVLRLYLWFCMPSPPRPLTPPAAVVVELSSSGTGIGSSAREGRMPLSINDDDDDQGAAEVTGGGAGGKSLASLGNHLIAGCKYLFCCCGCYCLRRIFRTLKMQNNNAYVICAYKGHDFKKSSVHAEKLLKKFMSKGKYVMNNLQMVLFIVNSAICLSCAVIVYVYLYYAERQTLHEFMSIPWIIGTISFFLANLWFQSMYILLSTLMIAYIVDEQVDFGRGARRLPLLHLMFVQLYNRRYEQAGMEDDSNDHVVPGMEDKGRQSTAGRGRDGGRSADSGEGRRRLDMRRLLLEEEEEDEDSDREMETLVGLEDEEFEEEEGGSDQTLIAEYIGVGTQHQGQDHAFVYTPMNTSETNGSGGGGGMVAEGLSSLSAMSLAALQSLAGGGDGGTGRGRGRNRDRDNARTLKMMSMFNRSHGISVEQANAYYNNVMSTDIESIGSDSNHSGFEMSMRSSNSDCDDDDDVDISHSHGHSGRGGRGGGKGRSMLFKLQSIPEMSQSSSHSTTSSSSVSTVKSKSMAYV